MKILYLDDDPDEFELLERTLGLLQHKHIGTDSQVIGTTTIEEADCYLASARPDLLLVDYFLGSDTTSEHFIRRMISSSISPPVVLITGHPSLQLSEELLSAVADSDLYICHKRDLGPEGLSDLLDDVMEAHFRILVIDDDETDFEMITTHLSFYSGRRFECAHARSSAEAREILCADEAGFEAFIVDYQMRGETGTAFVRELVNRDYTQPIIICSGYSTLDMDAELMSMIASRRVKFLSKNNLSTTNLIKRLQPNHRKPN